MIWAATAHPLPLTVVVVKGAPAKGAVRVRHAGVRLWQGQGEGHHMGCVKAGLGEAAMVN